nr:NIN-like protein [Tanacetum cinerariifolium]
MVLGFILEKGFLRVTCKLKYLDEDEEWILMTSDAHVRCCISCWRSVDGPPRPGPPYMVPQQFLPVGRPNMVSQSMQHLSPRPGLPPPLAHGIETPPPPPPAA